MNSSKIFFILDELEEIYHNEKRPPELGHEEPLDGLILTVLSQNTNDKNRDSAFTKLKSLYPEWSDAAQADAKKIEAAVRTAGLAHTKAARIMQILEIIYKDFGEYSLKELAKEKSEFIRGYLRALPGVGAKTVACVMLFDMKRPAFPVDTHVTRISKRVGAAPLNDSPEKISQLYESVVPVERCLGGHVNIIAHGRAVCHAIKPGCKNCVLSKQCDFLNS
ncbi:MAG: endonuclease III [Synergistales bacterium]|nr:endonuclease III [Synergistales bacterium]MDY6401362.1 endonuclease III [Synergistales bacterium]MDY6404063.1 endonuclease III [Synergistales bacterium]MDY6410020.1 endonuclease III [Synergistales bacterium]MDY6414996.1 endonuclease III [Synergistales bacterium]